MKKSILVGQSDDSTTVINASSYGVTAEGMARSERVGYVHGMVGGIEDFLSGHATNLSLLTREDLNLLKQTSAAYLGSCRLKLSENLDMPVYSLLSEKLAVMNMGACSYIGGNDSMGMASKPFRYARTRRETISFIGVSKIIDNGLPVTDHTPGYRSAAKCVTSTVREIPSDVSVYQQPAVTIMELMGRHAGWAAAASALAKGYPGDNPLLIYTPEAPFSMEQFFKGVEQTPSRQPSAVICVSEGICDKRGRFICEYTDDTQIDTFGHKMLTGCVKILESCVCNRFRVRVRSMGLNVNQRCNSPLVSAADVEETECSGRKAAEKALQGEAGKVATCPRLSGPGYEPEYGFTEVDNVCNREKSFPAKWIAAEGFDIGSKFLDYTFPLIQGQPDHIMGNGLPKCPYRK